MSTCARRVIAAHFFASANFFHSNVKKVKIFVKKVLTTGKSCDRIAKLSARRAAETDIEN